MTDATPTPESNTAETAASAAKNSRFKRISSSVFSKKTLSAVFNMAAGAGVTIAAKTAVVATLGWAAAPAVVTLAASALAVGAASTMFSHWRQNRKLAKQGLEKQKLWTRKTGKKFAISSGFALVGGVIGLGFHDGVIQNWFHHLFGSTPAHAAIPVAPVVVHHAAAVVTPPACPTATQAFADAIKGHHVSNAVENALHRAASSNVHIAAQGTKDLGYYAFNGFGGVAKNTHLATELFHKAADLGNLQARTDMLYLQHYGMGGIVSNKASSLATIAGVHDGRAVSLGTKWAHAAGENWQHLTKTAPAFNSQEILKGFVPRCP